ncbi:succinyl-diaminopimelate desuccinylase [Helicobacter rodentium]|uniref:succinyl-diaminopimelate desuccinylase n=1 Tax=Helicobacter rodentium TaxID=59617 RepID=UPI0023555DB6|nr:succinyl-diaminopimelate desuccinylase [Helicobacter rodentium]
MQTNKTKSIEVLQQLIAYPTITPQECGIYAYIKEILSDFEALEFEKEGVKNLFLYKDLSAGNAESQTHNHTQTQNATSAVLDYGLPRDSSESLAMTQERDSSDSINTKAHENKRSNFSNAESQNKKSQKPHLCFAGHIDVVPPGEGWASEPFSPTIKEGFLYGRGAQDMKAGVAAFVCAIREFVDCLESQNLQTSTKGANVESQRVQDSSDSINAESQNCNHTQTQNATSKVSNYGLPRDSSESLAMTQKQDSSDSVNAESKKPQSTRDSSDSTNAQNFNGILSVLLTSDEEGAAIFGTKYTLECLKERDLLPDFAIVAEPTSVEKFGDMIKVGRRGSINGILKIFGQQGHVAYPKKCLNPVDIIAPHLSKISGHKLDKGSEEFEPSRIVVTDIRGGLEVVNVTPNDLKIMFNVRNSTQTSVESVRKYLEHLLAKAPHSLELNQSSKPFLTDKQSLLVQKIVKTLESQNGFAPELSTSGGTSDARYFAEFGVKVVECGVCNDSIHAINERVRMSEVEALQNTFAVLLAQWNL